MSDTEVTRDIFARLRARYADDRNGYVLLEDVGDGAGFGNSGWSDAIAMQTWPSKGLAFIGFEVKASRSDWKRELDRPGKNAGWLACCHEWYVAAPDGVVQLAELPAGWGLMLPSGATNLRIAKRSDRPAPEPVTMDMIAAIFRASANSRKHVLRQLISDQRAEIRAKECADHEELKRRLAAAERNYEELQDALGERWSSVEDVKAAAYKLASAGDDIDDQVRAAIELYRTRADRLAAVLLDDKEAP